jgi:hypothetical protein
MKTQRNQDLLFNWIFLSGLILLALNDHLLKWQYSNWLTGKLSDFVGLLILPENQTHSHGNPILFSMEQGLQRCVELYGGWAVGDSFELLLIYILIFMC